MSDNRVVVAHCRASSTLARLKHAKKNKNKNKNNTRARARANTDDDDGRRRTTGWNRITQPTPVVMALENDDTNDDDTRDDDDMCRAGAPRMMTTMARTTKKKTRTTTTKIPTRLNGAQARTREYCWATRVSGEVCGERSEPGSSLPYCATHRARGDEAFKIVAHPTLDGKILVATRDVPRGYKTVYWGERKSWRECGRAGRDHAMNFRSGGGVIDPTPCGVSSQLQFMSNPGPNEVVNNRSTNVCFGDTRCPKGTIVGREFMLCRAVKKDEQLTQWYGAEWFHSRGIVRLDTGTAEHPAPRKRVKTHDARVEHGAVAAVPLKECTNVARRRRHRHS